MPRKRVVPPTPNGDRPDDFDVLTPAEAAKLRGVSLTTLWRMKLPKVHRGLGEHRTGYLRKTIRLSAMNLKAS